MLLSAVNYGRNAAPSLQTRSIAVHCGQTNCHCDSIDMFKAVPRLGQYQGFGHRLTPQNVAAASKLCEDVMIDVPEEQQPSDAGQQEDSEDTLTSRDTLSTAKLCEDATVDIQEEQEPPDTSTDS
ncbi:Transmembrane protein 184C [Cricetulus griseus]|uniref:Transmembrane protein 184C n=1 Tax=Cricetulus griseus TaxID=10029 RepID=G3INI2_CRIGR|nr:Transmembrane protein 184C [Cricetulus griseus]EGW14825.1 Transmembrane protein 184C [Cricetulus griseus]